MCRKHRPSQEANNSSDGQEIPRILWNPKVYQNVHYSQPPVPIRGQSNFSNFDTNTMHCQPPVTFAQHNVTRFLESTEESHLAQKMTL
jgi:hypothetical protein